MNVAAEGRAASAALRCTKCTSTNLAWNFKQNHFTTRDARLLSYFISRQRTDKLAYGVKFVYWCAQDIRQNRERNGREIAPAAKGRTSHRMRRWACKSQLTVDIDLRGSGNGSAELIFDHHHHHHHYVDRSLADNSRAKILSMLTEDPTVQRKVVYDVLKSAAVADGSRFTASENQVRFVILQHAQRQLNGDSLPIPGETEMDAAYRVVEHLDELEPLSLDGTICEEVSQYWEFVALKVPAFAEIGARAVELALDGSHGMTRGGWELCAALAENKGHGYPISYLAIRPSQRGSKALGKKESDAKTGLRTKLTRAWFAAMRANGVNPEFVQVDKDFSEVSAAQRVWPDAKIALCLWHVKKAVSRKLNSGPNTIRTPYYVKDALDIIPTIDSTFLPTRHTANSGRRGGLTASGQRSQVQPPPPPTFSSQYTTPKPIPTPSFDPYAIPTPTPSFIVRNERSRDDAFARAVQSFKQVGYDEDLAKTMARASMEDAEAGESGRVAGEVEHEQEGEVDAMIGKGPTSGLDFVVEDMVATRDEVEASGMVDTSEPSGTYQTKRAKTAKAAAKGRTGGIANQEQQKRIEVLQLRHFCQHPLIPIENVGKLTSKAIYNRAAREMYEYCYSEQLADAWAYLWENWYRPGRWILWARSAYPKIPFWRTTMAVEAHWRVLKHDDLGKKRVSTLAALFAVIGNRFIPRTKRHLQELEEGDRTLNHRLRRSPWRLALAAEVRKHWKHAKEDDIVSVASHVAQENRVSPQRRERSASLDSNDLDADTTPTRNEPPAKKQRSSTTIPRGPIRAPLQPIQFTHNYDDTFIDPELAAIGAPPPSRFISKGRYFTDVGKGVCGCTSFLLSRFLICKHLVLQMDFKVLPTDRDESLWFDVVERRRVGPFWQVPAAAVRRAEGLEFGFCEELCAVEPENFLHHADEEEEEDDDEDEEGEGLDEDGAVAEELEPASEDLWKEVVDEEEEEGEGEHGGAVGAIEVGDARRDGDVGLPSSTEGEERDDDSLVDDDGETPEQRRVGLFNLLTADLENLIRLVHSERDNHATYHYAEDARKSVLALKKKLTKKRTSVGQGGDADRRSKSKSKSGGGKTSK